MSERNLNPLKLLILGSSLALLLVAGLRACRPASEAIDRTAGEVTGARALRQGTRLGAEVRRLGAEHRRRLEEAAED